MLHAHITSWVLALILFIIAISLTKKGNVQGSKTVKMILRVFYLFIIITGFQMLLSINVSAGYVLKAVLGIVVIGFFEMVLSKTAKREAAGLFWGLLVVSFVIVVYVGYKLPMSAF